MGRIHEAVQQGDIQRVEAILLARPDDLHKPDKRNRGWLPLHFVAKAGHSILMEVLLTRGAPPTVYDHDCWTPLHLAAGNGHRVVVGMLLGHGADVDARNTMKRTPLHVASMYGHGDVVKDLLCAHARVDICDKEGRTAAELASNDNVRAAFQETMSGQPASSSNSSVLHSAWMEKQSPSLGKRWQRRWFVLRPTDLRYYHPDSLSAGTQRGEIRVEDIQEVCFDSTDPRTFHLRVRVARHRNVEAARAPFVLRAASQGDAEAWVMWLRYAKENTTLPQHAPEITPLPDPEEGETGVEERDSATPSPPPPPPPESPEPE